MTDTRSACGFTRSEAKAILAAWNRACHAVQAAYYADWTHTTAKAIATYCDQVAVLRAAGMVGPDDVAVGR